MQSADFLSAVFFYLKEGENLNQNWIVENLNNAFSTWNGKLGELWGLVTTGPQTFKGGAVWGVMQSLHNALIGMRVMANCYMDSSAATWVYFDEIHVLLKDSMSADFLDSTWKRFRKYLSLIHI